MNRREMTKVIGVAVASAILPISALADDTVPNTFECGQLIQGTYLDDWHSWPEPFNKISQQAVDKLLKDNPGRQIENDRSYCIDKSHPSFPTDVPEIWKDRNTLLVREVRLTPAI